MPKRLFWLLKPDKISSRYLLFLFLIKFFLTFLIYSQTIPGHFPPQLEILKPGFFFYGFLYDFFWNLNLAISIFPSKIIFLLQNNAVQLFFLKVPFILLDLIILFCLLHLIIKRRLKRLTLPLLILFLFLPAVYFYFSVNNLNFKFIYFELINHFYYFSFQERLILWFSLVFFVITLAIFLLGFGPVSQKLTRILAILKVGLFRGKRKYLTFVALTAIIIMAFNGVFISLSKPEEVFWKGFWIWDGGKTQKENFYLLARKEFNLVFTPKTANLFITCQSEYKLFVNSEFIGRGPIPSNPPYQYYDFYQVAKNLKKGKNNLEVFCHNPFVDTHYQPKKPGGFLFQLEIKGNWQKKIIVSDSSWEVTEAPFWGFSPRMSDTLGFQEFYDFNKKIEKWNKAAILAKPPFSHWGRLMLRPIPPLVLNEVKPEKMKRENGVLVIDFGREVFGFVKVLFKDTTKNRSVEIGYGETLYQGKVDWGRTAVQRDKIIFSGDENLWESFGPRAFRYLEVKPAVDNILISTLVPGYPVTDNSYFDSSDPLLNEIYKVGKYTLRLAMQDRFMDSLVREQAQYIGDTRMQALVNYYTFGDKALIAKALREFSWSAQNDGFVRGVYPSSLDFIIPDYSLLYPTMVYEYYLHFQDLELVKELYPTIKRQFTAFEKRKDEKGLVEVSDWWVFIDWAEIFDKRLALNMFYYKALKDAARLASFIGEEGDTVIFSKERERIKEILLTSENISPQTYYLGVLFDLPLPKSKMTKTPIVTTYFNSVIAEALFKQGKEQEALDLIKNYWGKMIDCGATTWWETFVPEKCATTSEGESLSHAWGSGPTMLLPREILGITPLEPGFDKILFRPRITNHLKWVKGSIPDSVGGKIESSWEKNKDGFRFIMKIRFEKGKAQVDIPAFPNGRILLNKKEISVEAAGNGYFAYNLETPGEYVFAIQ